MDPDDELAVIKRFGINGAGSFPVFCCGSVAIESEVLGFLGIGAVAGKALVGENGQDFAGKVRAFWRGKDRGDEGKKESDANGHKRKGSS